MPLGGLAPCPLPLGGSSLDGLTAEQHARLAADLKACVTSAPFAVLSYAGVVVGYLAQHGAGVSAAPTITDLGVGDYRVTWEASYLDEYDVAQPTNIRMAQATAWLFGAFSSANIITEIESPRQVRLRTFQVGGGAVYRSFSLVVW